MADDLIVMKKIILSLLPVLLLLTSCSSPKYTADELRPVVDDLLEKSAELNEIYFGTGLPAADDVEEAKKFYDSFDYDIESINYHPVSADAPYQTESDLRAATLEVFTEDYSKYLFERAFSGISETFTDENEEIATVESVVYAMYIETDGILTVRLDLDKEAIQLGREYNTSDMEIIRCGKDYVLVKIPTEMNGEQTDIELKLVNTSAGWRLDSPTY